MGKRKSAAKPPPKKSQEKLATVFSCPFCNHDNSVECRMDRKNQIGEASCRICQEKFSTPIDGMHGLLFESQEKRSQQEWPSHQSCSSWKTDLFLSISWSTDLRLVRCHGCVVKQITIILLWS